MIYWKVSIFYHPIVTSPLPYTHLVNFFLNVYVLYMYIIFKIFSENSYLYLSCYILSSVLQHDLQYNYANFMNLMHYFLKIQEEVEEINFDNS